MAAITVALAGDTMLGRGVAETLREAPGAALLAPELLELCRSADLFVCNLECCVSSRGSPWAAPGKPFHFRAPPLAAERLAGLGVDLVTLANNHALDFGPLALEDTIEHLAACGVAAVGAAAGRRPGGGGGLGHRPPGGLRRRGGPPGGRLRAAGRRRARLAARHRPGAGQ